MPMQQVSWDDALTVLLPYLKHLLINTGPIRWLFMHRANALTEEYYVVNKLMKGFIGSNNIDTNSRLCMSSVVAVIK
jgi:ferredoxin-nitrate reductase